MDVDVDVDVEDLGRSALGIRCRFSLSVLGLKTVLSLAASSDTANLASSFSEVVVGACSRVVIARG